MLQVLICSSLLPAWRPEFLCCSTEVTATLNAFLKIAAPWSYVRPYPLMKASFNLLDRDHGGEITKDNLLNLFGTSIDKKAGEKVTPPPPTLYPSIPPKKTWIHDVSLTSERFALFGDSTGSHNASLHTSGGNRNDRSRGRYPQWHDHLWYVPYVQCTYPLSLSLSLLHHTRACSLQTTQHYTY